MLVSWCAASLDALLSCLEFSCSSGATGVCNTTFVHEYFLLNKGAIDCFRDAADHRIGNVTSSISGNNCDAENLLFFKINIFNHFYY